MSRLITVCMAVVMCAMPASTILLPSAADARQASLIGPRSAFERAMERLTRSPRFEFAETDYQREGGSATRFSSYRYDLRYVAPHRVQVQAQVSSGGGWQPAGEWRQVGRTRCTRSLSKWSCAQAPFVNVQALVTGRLLGTAPRHQRFSAAASAAASKKGTAALTTVHIESTVRAAGQPFQVQYGSHVVLVTSYAYHADLQIVRTTRLPISFFSRSTVHQQLFMRKEGRFTYSRRVRIELPTHP